MTTIDTHPDAASAPAGTTPIGRFLAAVGSWVTSTDHKRVGRLYIGFSLLFAVAAIGIGALLGFERIDTGDTALDRDAVAQMFSLYRVGLAFMVVVPLMLGLAVAVVPLQVGSKAIAFPRAAAVGMWAWLAGSGLVIAAYAANGGPGGGEPKAVALFLAAMALLAIGLVVTAGSVAATVLTSRAPGMTLDRAPMFAWSALVGAVGLLLALPVLVGALVYLYVADRYEVAAFGGKDGILGWIGWALTQPQTYVFAVPTLGIIAEVVPVFGRTRQPLRAALLVACGLLGTAMLAGVTQISHPLRWTGDDFFDNFGNKFDDLLPYALFNLLPALGVLVVLALSGLALRIGRPRPSGPLVMALLSGVMLLVGVLAHVLAPISSLDLAGTVYEEGVFTYVLYASVLAGLAGVAYWGPKLWGRTMPDGAVLGLGALGLLGIVLSSFPYLIAGFADQPALAVDFDYSGPAELWNTAVLVGHGLMALTVLAFVLLALKSFTSGATAGDDPWDGQTLEWATSSPPPDDNFPATPLVSSEYPLLDLKPRGSDD
jgi:heme/copper-type cytochrome/quinol oxidase subunit 1